MALAAIALCVVFCRMGDSDMHHPGGMLYFHLFLS